MEVFLIVLSVVIVVLAAFAIPVNLQLWRTARSMALTFNLLNQHLSAILKNMDELTANANRTTAIVSREVEDLSLTIRKMQGTLSLLVGIEEIVRRNLNLAFSRRVRTSMAVAKGVRVFLNYLLSRRPSATDCR